MSTTTELQAWLNGTINGGPNGDGRYPLTAKDGTVYLVYCPAAQANNPTLSEQPVELYVQQAQAAASSANTAAQETDTDRIAAETAAANAASSASSALASKNAAATSEANALSSKNSAAASATTATTKAGEAATAANTASSAKTASEAARDKASLWANAAMDVVVESGAYSAKHWAQKAQAAVTGTLKYKGTWDATATFPSSPVLGDFYKVDVAGTKGSIDYAVGDQIIFNGTDWDKVDNTEQVISVAGRTGNIVLMKTDVGLGSVDNTADAVKNVATAAKWATARTLTVGGTGKSVNGSANVAWSLTEIFSAGQTAKTFLAAPNGAAGAPTFRTIVASDLPDLSGTYQPLDAGLQSIAGLSTASNQGLYLTGTDTYATFTLTAAGRTFLGAADAAAQRTSLGLGTMATQNANAVAITGGTIDGVTLDGGIYGSTSVILKPKKSTTASAVPTTAMLADGEMAINTTDRKWYVRVGAAIADMFAGLVARTDTVGVHTSVRQTDARYSEGNGSRAGFYKITLPVTWNNTMPMIRIVGRHYSQSQYWEMVVGGYLYTAGSVWAASAVYLVGGAFPSSWKVRLGHDGTNCCIVIGDTSGSGNVGSSSIEVKDFVSRGGIPDTGWSVSVLTSDTGITYSGADNADGSKNLLSADQDITLASTRSIYKTETVGSGGASKTGAFMAQRWAYSAGAVVFKSANLATTNAFFSIRIRGFHYGVGVIDTIISSYLAGGTFSSVYKTVAGSYDIPIRLAVSPDGYACVLVGDTTTSGHRFFVLESYLGSNALTLTSGWTSSEVTDYSTYTNVITPNQTALAANVASAAVLTIGRTINGTTFNGSANITTANWGTARTLTIGATGKSVNGSANVSWTLAEIGAAAVSHTHAIAEVTGLQTALDGKASTAHTHAIASITDLQSALDGKAAVSHSHAITDVTGLQSALNGKAATATTVDGYGITDAVKNGGGVANIVKLTQTAFDALSVKDASTAYFIVG